MPTHLYFIPWILIIFLKLDKFYNYSSVRQALMEKCELWNRNCFLWIWKYVTDFFIKNLFLFFLNFIFLSLKCNYVFSYIRLWKKYCWLDMGNANICWLDMWNANIFSLIGTSCFYYEATIYFCFTYAVFTIEIWNMWSNTRMSWWLFWNQPIVIKSNQLFYISFFELNIIWTL